MKLRWQMGNRVMLFQLIDEYKVKQVKQEQEPCFVLSSGKHTRMKYDFERLFQYVSPRQQFAEAFAMMFAGSSVGHFITVAVGPESMGPFLVELQHYYTFKNVRIALAKKGSNGSFFLGDSLDLRATDRCLIVDDVLTTGKTLCGLLNAVRNRKYVGPAHSLHPAVVGSAVIVNRMSEHGTLVPYVPEPLVSLLYDHEYPVYAPGECPFRNCPERGIGGE